MVEEKVDIAGKCYLIGHSKRYVKVAIKSQDETLVGEIVKVSIVDRLNNEYMHGKIQGCK